MMIVSAVRTESVPKELPVTLAIVPAPAISAYGSNNPPGAIFLHRHQPLNLVGARRSSRLELHPVSTLGYLLATAVRLKLHQHNVSVLASKEKHDRRVWFKHLCSATESRQMPALAPEKVRAFLISFQLYKYRYSR